MSVADTGEEKILVCISSSPSNPKVIRAAHKLASAFRGSMTALFIETPSYSKMADEDRERLASNLRLAECLGANIETVTGENVPFQIAEYARLAGITKIVLGHTNTTGDIFGRGASLVDSVIALAPELDLYIIPDKDAKPYTPAFRQELNRREILRDTVVSLFALLAATLLGYLFQQLGFTDANIIMMYLLGLLVVAATTSHRVYSLVWSVASVLLFDLLFTRPRFSFLAYDTGYPVTFIVMFAAAFFISSLAIRLKENERQSAKTARLMSVVLETEKRLSTADGEEEIIGILSQQLGRLLGRDVTVGSGDDESKPGYSAFPVHAGEAVVLISTSRKPLEASEKGVLLSIIGECSLALENLKNRREKEESLVLAENERLRSNLLRSVSHDLRTPLTSIMGNADNLINGGDSFDESERRELQTAIYDDAVWLLGLVENLLSSSRVEGSDVKLNVTTELLDDIINEAISRMGRRLEGHRLIMGLSRELIFVECDAALAVQVVVNLLDNAVKYTPADSEIKIETFSDGKKAHVRVSDNGDGVPESERTRIFDAFYTGSGDAADSRRSHGFGLALCRSIVKAHSCEIWCQSAPEHGTAFEFTLPVKEVDLNG